MRGASANVTVATQQRCGCGCTRLFGLISRGHVLTKMRNRVDNLAQLSGTRPVPSHRIQELLLGTRQPIKDGTSHSNGAGSIKSICLAMKRLEDHQDCLPLSITTAVHNLTMLCNSFYNFAMPSITRSTQEWALQANKSVRYPGFWVMTCGANPEQGKPDSVSGLRPPFLGNCSREVTQKRGCAPRRHRQRRAHPVVINTMLLFIATSSPDGAAVPSRERASESSACRAVRESFSVKLRAF